MGWKDLPFRYKAAEVMFGAGLLIEATKSTSYNLNHSIWESAQEALPVAATAYVLGAAAEIVSGIFKYTMKRIAGIDIEENREEKFNKGLENLASKGAAALHKSQ